MTAKWALLSSLFVSSAVQASDYVPLFNGCDFSGWTFFLEEKGYNTEGKGEISDFATIKPGGVIELNPEFHGALMTERDYLDYDLHVEYRWVDPQPRDDSGIFLRIRSPFVWDMEHGEQARFYMLQIQPKNTGDLWVLGYSEALLKTDPKRSYKPFGELELAPGGHIRRHLKINDAELPLGRWNSLDISVRGKTIKAYVNGVLANQGAALVNLPGRIGLESERGRIQYRNISIRATD